MPDFDSKTIPVLDDVIDANIITEKDEVIDLSSIDTLQDDNNFDLFADEFADSKKSAILDEAPTDKIPPLLTDIDNTTVEIDSVDDVSIFSDDVSDSVSDILIDDETISLDSHADVSIDVRDTSNSSDEFDLDDEFNTFTIETEEEPEIESALINYHGESGEEIELIKETLYTAEPVIEHPVITLADEKFYEPVTEKPVVDERLVQETEEETSVDDSVIPESISNEQTNFQPVTAETEPTQNNIATISLTAITDDIVRQILPDIEQQLRNLVQQALEQRIPEEFIEKPASDDNNSNN